MSGFLHTIAADLASRFSKTGAMYSILAPNKNNFSSKDVIGTIHILCGSLEQAFIYRLWRIKNTNYEKNNTSNIPRSISRTKLYIIVWSPWNRKKVCVEFDLFIILTLDIHQLVSLCNRWGTANQLPQGISRPNPWQVGNVQITTWNTSPTPC